MLSKTVDGQAVRQTVYNGNGSYGVLGRLSVSFCSSSSSSGPSVSIPRVASVEKVGLSVRASDPGVVSSSLSFLYEFDSAKILSIRCNSNFALAIDRLLFAVVSSSS